MIVIVYPLAIAVAGLLVYVLANSSTSAKLAEIGRIIFFCGVFVLVWILAEGKLKL